jgi:hypothetical protein
MCYFLAAKKPGELVLVLARDTTFEEMQDIGDRLDKSHDVYIAKTKENCLTVGEKYDWVEFNSQVIMLWKRKSCWKMRK